LPAEHEPPIFQRGNLIVSGNGFFKIDLVVVGRLVARCCGIQPPQLAVGDDHPRGDLLFQQADHLRAWNFKRHTTVAFCALARFVYIVKVAVPYIGQCRGDGFRFVAGCIEQVICCRSCRRTRPLPHKIKAKQLEHRLVQPFADHILRLAGVVLTRCDEMSVDLTPDRPHVFVPLGRELRVGQALLQVVI
jgi:hypothetical protein